MKREQIVKASWSRSDEAESQADIRLFWGGLNGSDVSAVENLVLSRRAEVALTVSRSDPKVRREKKSSPSH